MPRIHKRREGARPYKAYSEETLDEALQEVSSGRMNLREASQHFKIPLGTMRNRHSFQHCQPVGGPPSLTRIEEMKIIDMISLFNSWGFPISLLDIRYIAKEYLMSVSK